MDVGDAQFQAKVVFLLGLTENNETQDDITSESQTYDDVIQEGFWDSYNNLTLKSIMMLKWVVNNCDRKGLRLHRYLPHSWRALYSQNKKVVKKIVEEFKKRFYPLFGAKTKFWDTLYYLPNPFKTVHFAFNQVNLSKYSIPTIRGLKQHTHNKHWMYDTIHWELHMLYLV